MGLIEILNEKQKRVVAAVKEHAETLLDHTPNFKYFTLHGSSHIENMFNMADTLINNGISLNQDEAFLLSLSICIHDLGMVVPLSQLSFVDVFSGKNQIADPASLELFIRQNHHELIDKYMEDNFIFLTNLGVSPSDCAVINEIGRGHRKIPLSLQYGTAKNLGALLRVIDEFDIGPERAPIAVLRQNYKDMDGTSCWHWFKHNIVEHWRIGDNVVYSIEDGIKNITFKLIVHPPHNKSIPYWSRQIARPINKTLIDDGAADIIFEKWKIRIKFDNKNSLSKSMWLGQDWDSIEEKALSHGRKVILLIDDEVRKMEDLFIPLMERFHIEYSPNARDAFIKLEASKIDLAVVDLQVSSGEIWSADETEQFKSTGKNICKEILLKYPKTKIGILTGSRYEVDVKELPLVFFLRKPVDPEKFEEKIYEVLN